NREASVVDEIRNEHRPGNRPRRREVARLIYTTITSLDGYVEDTDGEFDWAEPDDEVHAFVNDLERSVGTYLYGRRMYETMVFWETAQGLKPVAEDYAEIWRSAQKIVFSRTLEDVSSEKTRVEREFDAAAVQQMKEDAGADIAIGGAELASHALAQGLVDEIRLFVVPILVGGGKKAMPAGLRADLELIEERGFSGGFTYLRYRI